MGSEAQSRASTKYNKSRDNIMIRPTQEEGAKIRKAAEDAGKSVQAFILDILREHISKGPPFLIIQQKVGDTFFVSPTFITLHYN